MIIPISIVIKAGVRIPGFGAVEMAEHAVRIGGAGGRGVAGERFAERGVAEAGGGAGGRIQQQVGGAEVVGQGQQGARNAAGGGRVDDGKQAADAAGALRGVATGGLADEVGAPDVFEAADRAEGSQIGRASCRERV